MKNWTNYVGVALALLGLVWGAATQWQTLKDRVSKLEDKELYLHGEIRVPQGAK